MSTRRPRCPNMKELLASARGEAAQSTNTMPVPSYHARKRRYSPCRQTLWRATGGGSQMKIRCSSSISCAGCCARGMSLRRKTSTIPLQSRRVHNASLQHKALPDLVFCRHLITMRTLGGVTGMMLLSFRTRSTLRLGSEPKEKALFGVVLPHQHLPKRRARMMKSRADQRHHQHRESRAYHALPPDDALRKEVSR